MVIKVDLTSTSLPSLLKPQKNYKKRDFFLKTEAYNDGEKRQGDKGNKFWKLKSRWMTVNLLSRCKKT